jgi:hypothetical protein
VNRRMIPMLIGVLVLGFGSVLLGLAPAGSDWLVPAAQARKPTPAPTQAPAKPDFRLDYATYGYTDLGYVVRGGQETCEGCSDTWEPRFVDRSTQACFYGSNQFSLTSVNGFEGIVSIGVSSSAPRGVTSKMVSSVFVPKAQTVLVPFSLTAATDGSGFGLVLVQAIGKGGTTPTHSIYHEVWVVDELPACE